MASKCRYCSYMDLSDKNSYGDCYCSYYGKYYDPDSNGCSRNDNESDGVESSGGCYLTTAMCQILSKPDDCYELEVLRDFREKYMRNTDEGIQLLQEYDIISPPISKKILSHENRKNIALKMLEDFINPAIKYINEHKYKEAINMYKDMVCFCKNIK